MKKNITNKLLIGGGVIALIYFLYKSQKNKEEGIIPEIVIDDKDTIVRDYEDPLKDVPSSCLKPFSVGGKTYEIKNGKFYAK